MAKKNEQPVIRIRSTRSARDDNVDHDTYAPPAKKPRLRRVTMPSPAVHTIKPNAEPSTPRSTRKSSVSRSMEKLAVGSPGYSAPVPAPGRIPGYLQPEVWTEVDDNSAVCIVCNSRIVSKGRQNYANFVNHLATLKHQRNIENMKERPVVSSQLNVVETHVTSPRPTPKASPPPTFHEPITPAATPTPTNDSNTPTNNPSRAKIHIINHINGMRALWESHYQIPIGLNQLRISTTLARHTPLTHLAMGVSSDDNTTLANALRSRVEVLDGVIKSIEQGLGELLDGEMLEIRSVQDGQGNIAQYQNRCNRLREARKGAVELGELFKEAMYDFQLAEDLLTVADHKLAEGTTKVEKFAEVLKSILSEALVELARA